MKLICNVSEKSNRFSKSRRNFWPIHVQRKKKNNLRNWFHYTDGIGIFEQTEDSFPFKMVFVSCLYDNPLRRYRHQNNSIHYSSP